MQAPLREYCHNVMYGIGIYGRSNGNKGSDYDLLSGGE